MSYDPKTKPRQALDNDDSDSDGTGEDVQPVLSGIIKPLLEACRLSSDGLDPSDAAVFMVNNVDIVREALVAHAVRYTL